MMKAGKINSANWPL